MPGKIWERYFLKEVLKTFGMILFCFYGLYIVIDYASRAGSQSLNSSTHWKEVMQYYLFELIQRLDVFIPFALLIATIRTLTRLNAQNELIALLSSGIKMKALLKPFLAFGLFFVAVLYLNQQYMIPYALQKIRHTRDIHQLHKNKKGNRISVQSVPLKDRTVLLYQSYDPAAELFFDAYWIKSFNEIYHIKRLSPKSKMPVGTYVDLIERTKNGKMQKTTSYERREFPEMRFNKRVLLDTITPPEELSLTKLWQSLPSAGKPSNEKQAQLAAAFYQKLVLPWFCLIAILGPAPFCVRFSRHFPVFFIYAFSIFGLAACYIILDASLVIAGRQVSSPLFAIITPFIVVQGIILWNYARLK